MPIAELHPDYENRRIFYGADAPDNVRESLAYLLPLPGEGLGVIVYTWVHAAGADGMGRAGAMAVVYGPGVAETVSDAADGIGVPDAMGFDDWRVGPIRLLMSGTTTSSLVFTGKRISIHFMELRAFGRTSVHGYVHRDRVTALITGHGADFDLDGQLMHTDVRVTFTDEAGRTTRVRTWRGADLRWPVSPRLTLHEAAMHAEVEGAPAVAYIEMAWPPEYLDHHAGSGPGVGALTVDRRIAAGSASAAAS